MILFYFYLRALYINLISHLTHITDSSIGPVGVKYRWLCWIHVMLNQFVSVLVGGEENKEKNADFRSYHLQEWSKEICHESMHCHQFPRPNTVLWPRTKRGSILSTLVPHSIKNYIYKHRGDNLVGKGICPQVQQVKCDAWNQTVEGDNLPP